MTLPDLLRKLREPMPEDAAGYDQAIQRAGKAARRHEKHVRRERSKSSEALALLREKGAAGLLSARHLQGLAGYWALLDRSFELRYDDPAQMIDLARLALIFAERLDSKRYGAPQAADFRCHAAVELGNAYRVADRLGEAATALGEAAEAYLQGTRDPLLKARMCDVQASLLAGRRSFDAACEALDAVYRIRLSHCDSHLAGRSLLSKGLYTNYKGDPREAIRLIKSGLDLIDGEKDPELLFVAVHNLARCLVETGDARKARVLLWSNLRRYDGVIGRVSWLKLRWLWAQISVGLNLFTQAESSFREVKEGFREAGLHYKEALVTLEMALLAARQHKKGESRRLALEAVEVFNSLQIRRESMAAVLVLQHACEARTASTALIEFVLEFMIQAEDGPTLSFEAWLERS